MSQLHGNPYEILGVSQGASDDVIRRAYRRQARETHPDHHGSAGAFEEVQYAYDLLGDPGRRARYDTSVARSVREPEVHAPSGASSTSSAAGATVPHSSEARPPKGPAPWWSGRRPIEWHLFARSVLGVCAVTVLTSVGRGWGILPHQGVPLGAHLLLGNFVEGGTYWMGASSLHHGWIAGVGVAGLGYSMVISVPWLWRSRNGDTVTSHEQWGFALVVGALFVVNRSVVLTPGAWVLGVLAVLVWFYRVDERTRQTDQVATR